MDRARLITTTRFHCLWYAKLLSSRLHTLIYKPESGVHLLISHSARNPPKNHLSGFATLAANEPGSIKTIVCTLLMIITQKILCVPEHTVEYLLKKKKKKKKKSTEWKRSMIDWEWETQNSNKTSNAHKVRSGYLPFVWFEILEVCCGPSISSLAEAIFMWIKIKTPP